MYGGKIPKRTICKVFFVLLRCLPWIGISVDFHFLWICSWSFYPTLFGNEDVGVYAWINKKRGREGGFKKILVFWRWFAIRQIIRRCCSHLLRCSYNYCCNRIYLNMSFLLTTIDERISDAKVSGNGEPWICVSLIRYFWERHQIPCVLCKFDRFSPLNKILP